MQYIFRDRHIKNVSANKLDSVQQLPSEMMAKRKNIGSVFAVKFLRKINQEKKKNSNNR